MQQEISINPALEIPEDIICPITAQIMTDPVMLIDSGNTYEREGILQWLEKNNTDPLTNEVLNSKSIKPNLMAKRLIASFLDKQKEIYPDLIHETYFPDSLIQTLISALHKNEINLFAQTLSKDSRLLSNELNDNKNLFIIACEFASVEILNIVLNKLQDKSKNSTCIQQDNSIALFLTVSHRLGIDGAKLIAKYLDWKHSDFQKILEISVEKNDIEMVEITLQLDAVLTKELLHKAYNAKATEMVKILLLSYDVIKEKDKLVYDFLIKTIKNNDKDLSLFILSEKSLINKMNLNAKNEQHKTPLDIAYQNYDENNFIILKTLIQSGAQMNDLLIKSIQNQQSALVEFLLLEAVAHTNPNITDINGQSAFLLAIEKAEIETVMLLLQHPKINLAQTDPNGNTALHLAVKQGNDKLVSLLLRKGFDPSLRNHDGVTPMELGKTSSGPLFQRFRFFQLSDKPSGSLYTFSGHTDIVYCLEKLGSEEFASGSWDKTIKIWREEQCVMSLQGHSHNVICLQYMNENSLVSGSSDKTIKLWDLKTARCIETLSGHSGTIRCLQRLNAAYLASGSSDKTIKLWDLKLKKCVKTLYGHMDSINTLALCANGQLASGSWDNCIKIWDVQTGTCLQTLKGHEGVVRCLLPLPNGQLISGSRDKTIKVWDVIQGTCLATLTGHTDSVNCLCIIEDGYLCSGAWDKTIRIWDLVNHTLVNTCEGHTGAINSLILQEGGVLLSSSDDKSIRAWHSDTLLPSQKTQFISHHY